MADKLAIILKYFTNLSIDSLPCAIAALYFCRLICFLSSLYHVCLRKLSNLNANRTGSDVWKPDLFFYTKKLLNKNWADDVYSKGSSYRLCLQSLIAFHLRSKFHSFELSGTLSDSVDLVHTFASRYLMPTVRRLQSFHENKELEVDSEDVLCEDYRTLTSETIDVYCREVLETVVWFAKHLCTIEKRTNDGVLCESVGDIALLTQWNQCVTIVCLITNIFHKPGHARNSGDCSKKMAAKHNFLIHLLPTVMRTGRLFLQSILKGAMPCLNGLFRSRVGEVTAFLKNTQQLTRFLQRVCTHAKAYKNSQLTNQVPATKRCLETFVYRVKILLSQNRCVEAFWLGTLKNRDLHGVEVQDNDQDETELDDGSSSIFPIDNQSLVSTEISHPDSRNSSINAGKPHSRRKRLMDEDSNDSADVSSNEQRVIEGELLDSADEEDQNSESEEDLIEPSDED